MIYESELSSSRELQKGGLKRLLKYTRPHVASLSGAFFLLLLATASDVVGPVLIQRFIDRYLTHRYFPLFPVLTLAIWYLGLQWTSAAFNYLQMVFFQSTAMKIIQQMRVEVFAKVQHLDLAFFDKTPGGSLVSRITNDTEAIKELFFTVLSTFVQNIIQMTGIFISMFYLDYHLALFCILILPILILIMQGYRRLSNRMFHTARSRLSMLNAKLNESLQGMYLIQAMRQQSRLEEEFSGINQLWRKARVANIKLNSVMLRPLVDIVYYSALVLVLAFFGHQALHRTIDTGVLYAFINYLDRLFEPVNDMMQRLNVFQQAVVSAERVFYLLDETEMAPLQIESATHQVTAPAIEAGMVVFDNVSFSYDGKTNVLENISFTAFPGQTVALVGHTGSGKSSIVNLLMRFYAIRHGEIKIDGIPLQAIAETELRSKMGLVLQDPFIFAGNIADNIRLGNTSITDEQVTQAAEFVQASGFIQKLPNAYHEPVSERGSTFSSGQRQLLSFARTMAMQPKILILDEATASIDTETEEAIQSALQKMRLGRTTIAIAHRLSTIQDADLILVLHHGRIVERGTHQELLGKGGLYHKMYLLQQGSNLREIGSHTIPSLVE